MLPIGGGKEQDSLQQGEEMKAKAMDLNASIDSVAPEEVQKQLWEILAWRDDIMKDIAELIQSIPGLEDLLDQITEALNVYVFTILEPFMTPILQDATGTLQTGSSAVIESNHENQYEVFDDPNASDPSHSLLSKDHFALILNEPAGLVAIVVVKHIVNLVVQAWYDNSDIDQVIEQVLEVFHHPYYATGRSQVQHDMEEALRRWIEGMSDEDREIVLQNLTKEAVRDGRNKRAGHEDDDTGNHGHAGVPAYDAGLGRAVYGSGPGSGASPRQDRFDSSGGGRQTHQTSHQYGQPEEEPSYNRPSRNEDQEGEGYGQPRQQQHRANYGEETGYYGQQEQQQPSYRRGGNNEEQNTYGGGGFGRSEERNTTADYGYGGARNESSDNWIGRRNDDEGNERQRQERTQPSYQSENDEYGYGGSQGGRGQYGEAPAAEGGERYYGGQGEGGYGGQEEQEEHHGRHHKKKHHEEQEQEQEQFSYGGQRNNESSYGGGYSQGETRASEGWNTQQSEGYGYEGSSGRRGGQEQSYRRGGEEGGYGYGGTQNEEGGYGGGRRRRGEDAENDENETFGAERLNLDENTESRRQRDYYESEY